MAKSYFKKTRKAPHKYKSPSQYLKALYMANKKMIDNKFIVKSSEDHRVDKTKTAYEMFKKEIAGDDTFKSLSIQDVKMRAAELSTTQLYGRERQLREDIRDMFKKDKFALDTIRRQIGWKEKLDWNNVKYHGDRIDKDNRYFYFEVQRSDNQGRQWTERVAFKLGDFYNNKKRIKLVTLDQNNDVATEYSSMDFRGW